MKRYLILLVPVLCILAMKPLPNLPKEVADEYRKLPDSIDYNLDVKPILSDKCFKCHGPDKAKQKAGLRLDMPESAFAPLPESPGKFAIVPKNLQKSELYKRILSKDPELMMPDPKSNLQLTAREKAVLIKWIEQGAVYQPHWAFVKPFSRPVPDVKGAVLNNPIDNFIVSRIQKEGWQQSPIVNKELLLRRLSLDLVGLPPSIEEIDSFVNDHSPNAYEKQVDRLLNSPHYGERMASPWLDLARFADSHGYTVDRLRDMSPYRDWVINAFNSNMSYKDFIHYQLAGDLMPSPTKDMLIATAFNRNHQQNMEGGIIEKEFQTEYVVDRTNTFGDAFMGISVGCARCHDHKYDPFSQENYYQLFSFFNNVREAGQISWNDDPPTPTILLTPPEKEKTIAYLNSLVQEKEKSLVHAQQSADEGFQKWLSAEQYKKLIDQKIPRDGLLGYYNFEDSLKDVIHPERSGVMKQDGNLITEGPKLEKYEKGQYLSLDGDKYLDLKTVGVFRKGEAFSVGMWVNIPASMKDGVIFHKSNAERLYNYKGYNLSMVDGKLEFTLAHTAPSNAITKRLTTDIPTNQWIQITMTYDGSSKVAGLNLYINGSLAETETVIDQLYKDIIFFEKDEPALQIGAWYRGIGFKGGKVDDILIYNRVLTNYELEVLANQNSWQSICNKKPAELNASDLSTLKAYYISCIDPNILQAQSQLTNQRNILSDSTEKIPELMVMQEMPKPKKTFLLKRGQYDAPGKEVFPGTAEKIFPFSDRLPKNRYGLALWLTDENNPLTARVAVNHLWQNIFGTGLVKTSEDFGNQGEMPSHPALLDWLAIEFMHSGWDVKKMVKLMVMSATYQQDSKPNEEMKERDPENRLLARGPSNRLTAEMIRDNALFASGLLNPKIGGKSIYPYQPDGLWDINGMDYVADSSNQVYRRSLYVVVKRSVPNPTLAYFDASSRSSCIVRRQKTNTPLQALVTLNDPTFVEASKVLGEQMAAQVDLVQAIQTTFRKLTGRTATAREIDLLVELQKAEYSKFKENPKRAKGWLKAGLYELDKTKDLPMIAANAVVANTILNSDATLNKR